MCQLNLKITNETHFVVCQGAYDLVFMSKILNEAQ